MTQLAWSLDRGPDDLLCRVVDVGAGECCVIVIPGGHYVVFDGGNYKDGGATAMQAVEELIPEGATIDLMVISHSDSDHLAAIDDILDAYRVTTILHTGDRRTTNNWIAADAAIRNAAENFGTENLNLETATIEFGKQFNCGAATVTFVAGWHKAPESFGTLSSPEAKNAISVVVRVDFQGKSILLTGDSVGRHIDDPATTCIAAEKFMVDNAETILIRSDVLVAAHHGADNGSSSPFIQAVRPQFVVFSAGHAFQHPRQSTAGRFFTSGLSPSAMFRTDRGDDEGSKEWDHLRIPGHVDPAGDDDVDILIRGNGQIRVDYRRPDAESNLRNVIAMAGRREDATPGSRGTPQDSPVADTIIGLNTNRRRTEAGVSAASSASEPDRAMERVLRQLDELRDDLRKCRDEKSQSTSQRDPLDTVRSILDVIRNERRPEYSHVPGIEVEWDAMFSALISFVVTALGAATLSAKERLRKLEEEKLNALKTAKQVQMPFPPGPPSALGGYGNEA